jgi:hypothetical protein
MRACQDRSVFVCGRGHSKIFTLSDSFFVAPLTAALLSEVGSDGSHARLPFEMIFHRFDLSLPVFRGSKGRIRTQLSLQQLRRPYRIHTPLVSANAVIMWCMECLWISYRMRLMDRAPVCMGGEGFFAYRVFGSYFSLESSRGCRAGSGSGRPCLHASIVVPRGGAWSASHPWIPDLT